MHQLRARLKDGQPCLQVVDASGSCVRLAWQARDDAEARPTQQVRDVFRQLFLSELGAALSQRCQTTQRRC